ncbi:MAG: hypothetical protein KF770_14365 [Anaerolineae bacterium]|nr:hypothetical protein [Anaerolineae bacterium]
MGGRGASSGNGAVAPHRTQHTVQLVVSPGQLAFTNVFRDKAYHQHREQLRGSHGRLLSRQALIRAIEATSDGRTPEKLQDLAHARQATIRMGRYAETVKLVEDMPHDLVLPLAHKPFLHLDKDGGSDTAVTVTLHFDYTVITPDDETGGAIRYYLQEFPEWKIVARPARADVSRYTAAADTFGMEIPTLTWVASGQIRELYIPGISTAQFLERTRLGLFLEKGAPTAAKRISRALRDYPVMQGFPAEAVTIRYLNLNPKGAKVFDGAGLVSRRMLQKMALSPALSPEKRQHLLAELHQTRRVEYTILTPGGQDKGHAIVSEDLRDEDGRPVDFLLPKDTKRDTQDWSGQTVVGFHFVHHHDQMKLDDQSLINHHPFFNPDYLLERVQDRGQAFLNSIERGDYGAMHTIDPSTPIPNLMRWPLREFLASGGDFRWSPFLLRSYINQHIHTILHQDDHDHWRLRLPVEGARYYIQPALVGRRAGLTNLHVPRGHIQIDPSTATAWVNEEDWLELSDSPKGFHADGRSAGIADILGGADNDDAVWLYPFRDLDAAGERKILAWRSPNAPGEYVILKPTAASHDITWERADGQVISYPERHSHWLAERVDTRPRQTASLVDTATGGGMGEGQPYSLAAMELAVARATHNAGTLGRFVNLLMVYQAIGQEVELPAPLEEVIDAMNKTGADLAPINAWIDDRADDLRTQGTAVPTYLHHRVGPGTGAKDGRILPLQETTNHWLDQLLGQVQAHVREMETRRDELARQTTLPNHVLDYVFERPEAIELGAAYLQHYHAAYSQLRRARPSGLRPPDYDTLRQTAESYLNQFPPRYHEDILLGAAVSLYLRENTGSDAALWLPGEQTDKSFKPGIGNKMIAALRRVGVLHEITNTPGHRLAYGATSATERPYEVIGIQDTWLHWHQHQSGVVADGRQITQKERRQAKEHVQEMARGSLRGMTVTVGREGQAFVAYTPHGNRLGTLQLREGQHFTDGQSLTIRHALAVDGHLRVAVGPAVQATDVSTEKE